MRKILTWASLFLLITSTCFAEVGAFGYKPTKVKADDIKKGNAAINLTTSIGDVTIGSDAGAVDIITSDELNIKVGGDLDDHAKWATAANQTSLSWMGCPAVIASDTGDINLYPDNSATVATTFSTGGTDTTVSTTSGDLKLGAAGGNIIGTENISVLSTKLIALDGTAEKVVMNYGSNGSFQFQSKESASGEVRFYTGNDTDDYTRIGTTSNQPRGGTAGNVPFLITSDVKLLNVNCAGPNYTAAATKNAMTGTIVGIDALVTGLQVTISPAATSDGACTFNLNSLGAKKVVKQDTTTQVGSGEIIVTSKYLLVYDSTLDAAAGAWVLQGGTADYSRSYIMSPAEIAAAIVNNGGSVGKIDCAASGVAYATGSSTTAYTIALPAPDVMASTTVKITQITAYVSTVASGDYVATSVKSFVYTDGTYAEAVAATNVGSGTTGYTSATLLAGDLTLGSSKTYFLYCDSSVTDADFDIKWAAIKIDYTIS